LPRGFFHLILFCNASICSIGCFINNYLEKHVSRPFEIVLRLANWYYPENRIPGLGAIQLLPKEHLGGLADR
jgi:hypothetical protein